MKTKESPEQDYHFTLISCLQFTQHNAWLGFCITWDLKLQLWPSVHAVITLSTTERCIELAGSMRWPVTNTYYKYMKAYQRRNLRHDLMNLNLHELPGNKRPDGVPMSPLWLFRWPKSPKPFCTDLYFQSQSTLFKLGLGYGPSLSGLPNCSQGLTSPPTFCSTNVLQD